MPYLKFGVEAEILHDGVVDERLSLQPRTGRSAMEGGRCAQLARCDSPPATRSGRRNTTKRQKAEPVVQMNTRALIQLKSVLLWGVLLWGELL